MNAPTPQHTPGPWYVGNGDVYAEGDISTDYDDLVICAIGRAGGFRSHEYAVVKAHKPEGKANARLIAAAPDLLEALRPFAREFLDAGAKHLPDDMPWNEANGDDADRSFARMNITVGDFRRAIAAITKAQAQ